MRTTPPAVLEGLAEDVGADRVSTSVADRDAYSRDLWPRYLIETAAGHGAPAPPDAVVWPKTPAEVAAVVRRCADAGVPVVAFGAGSGVCGGAMAHRGGVIVDLKRMKAIRRVDAEAGVVEVEAGIIGSDFEAALDARALTLGHFPSSIMCSTVGGWLATRSAGQCSSRYGKIEDMVVDLEVIAGDGVIRRTRRSEIAGSGFDWNQIFVGSEGTLGLITAATLKVWPKPEARVFHGFRFARLADGLAAMRDTMQAGLAPAVVRLYDPLDTLMVGSNPDERPSGAFADAKSRLKRALSGGRGDDRRRSALQRVLSAPRLVNFAARLPRAVLLVTMAEGTPAEARDTDAALASIATGHGATDLGEAPGRQWFEHRYDVSFGQSAIYKSGAFADTMEVATTWSELQPLYDAVRRAVAPHAAVMAHFSHAYPGGCSIYFTFAGTAATPEAMRETYDAAWRAGLDAVVATGGVIAHHHGVGLSRARHMHLAHGEGRRWFEALKPVLDPAGVLNPGKLFAEEGAP